jgi:hypothetical protein
MIDAITGNSRMTIIQRSVKRLAVWDQMLRLEQEGLGVRELVSDQRDRFMLEVDHGAATALSTDVHARGFIRADVASLLFRNASDALHEQLAAIKPGLGRQDEKGYEIRWSNVDVSDIARMFDAVRLVAGMA